MGFTDKARSYVKDRPALLKIIRPVYGQYKQLYRPIQNGKVFVRYETFKNHGFPHDLGFGLTTRCNSRCTYCPRETLIREGIRHLGDVDFRVVQRVIDEFSTLPNKNNLSIGPVGLGEPLLYPRFFEVVAILRDKFPNAFIHTNTNAIALDEEKAYKLTDCGLDKLIISINAWDRATYIKTHQVDKFNQVVANVKRFLSIKRDKLPRAIIQILDIDINEGHLSEFINFWTPLLNKNDDVATRPLNDFGGTIIYEDLKTEVTVTSKKRYPCWSLFNTLKIDTDGFIYPCLGLAQGSKSDIMLGNIMNTKLSELYEHPGRLRQLQELHKKNQYHLIDACSKCNSWIGMGNIFFRFGGRWL